jgi:hypothetical protein
MHAYIHIYSFLGDDWGQISKKHEFRKNVTFFNLPKKKLLKRKTKRSILRQYLVLLKTVLPIPEYLTSVIRFQQFLVPVYYWKTVEIMITGVNYYENAHPRIS